jgi:tetratricopeptide (TPR) repeat protein
MLRTWIAPVKSFKIGDEEIRNTRLRVADSPTIDRDMLIGMDFFLSHHVYVANSQRKLYFTYNGGPVFNLDRDLGSRETAGADTDAGSEPTDAAGFAQRGAAFASRREYAKAIADFSKAVDLAPTNADFIEQRALADLGDGQGDQALSDLDRVLDLEPGRFQARVTRAEILLARKDRDKAIADLDAADRAQAKQADGRLELGLLYARAGLPLRAVDQYDLWIAAHPQDARRAAALNARCRARALDGHDLKSALSDCNSALDSAPKAASILDSRGLVRLRMGDLDHAIADYDAALATDPKIAWSLYGRGLAKLKKGDTAGGKADIDAAVALEPGLPDRAKHYGVGP